MVDKGERIFLLEVYVDNVNLENCQVNSEPVRLCVKFKFLNYPFLEIMGDEYCEVVDETCNVKFQSGKSCLFSLRRNPQGNKKPPLDLHISVVRIESESAITEIGKTLINLSESFNDLIQTANEKPHNGDPVSKIIKNKYTVNNQRNQTVGNITIFVRLSCFGKIIVTQFQMSGLESKSFLFKAGSDIRGKQFEGSGDAGGVLDSSMHSSKTGELRDGKAMISGKPGHIQTGIFGGPSSMVAAIYPEVMNSNVDPGMIQPKMISQGIMEPEITPGMLSPEMSLEIMGPRSLQGMTPPGIEDLGEFRSSTLQPFGNGGLSPYRGGRDYQNITATVNGHVLDIRVLRKPKKLVQPVATLCRNIEESSSSESEQPYILSSPCIRHCPKYSSQPACSIPRVPLCDCDIPVPPCLVGPPPPFNPTMKTRNKRKKKNTPMCPVNKGIHCRADCPLGFPKPPGIVPPSYAVSSTIGASPAATSEPQNFFISMGPRTQQPPVIPSLPSCITVRETQYEENVRRGTAPSEKKVRTGREKK